MGEFMSDSAIINNYLSSAMQADFTIPLPVWNSTEDKLTAIYHDGIIDYLHRVIKYGLHGSDQTATHCLAVAELSRKIYFSAHSKLPKDELSRRCHLIYQGAKIHDIGKVYCSLSTFNDDKLDDTQLKIVRNHVICGAAICQGMPLEIIEIIQYHHERFDGQGYPEGLKGKQIPPMARAVAVADVFSALISSRSYKKSYSPEEAIIKMTADLGHFDYLYLGTLREIVKKGLV